MKNKYIISSIVCLLIVMIGVSLSYFYPEVSGKQKYRLSLEGGSLQLIVQGSSDIVEGSITGGWTSSKTFTVTNNSDRMFHYDLVFKDLINTFVSTGLLQYKIDKGNVTIVNWTDVPKSNTSSEKTIEEFIEILPSSVQTYTLYLRYTNSNSNDIGATLSGNIGIKVGTAPGDVNILAYTLDGASTNYTYSQLVNENYHIKKVTCTQGNATAFIDEIGQSALYFTSIPAVCTIDFSSDYIETLLRGADPVLAEGLVPVIITQGGSDFIVTKADTTQEWYKYENSQWANAVKLIASPSKTYAAGETINHSDIESYFVWIPKYRYKIFDMGTYTGLTTLTTKNQEIQIEFGLANTTDVLTGTKQSCATPMTSGGSGNCAVDRWMTHPAFISLDVSGIWVGKFETTGTISAMTVKPNVAPIANQSVSTMFTNALAYDTSLESHMMKNTEWGAVAYLAHSAYGMGNNNIYINNYFNSARQTGCVGTGADTLYSTTCIYKWYETNGFKGSTTGNITGIYDISGGVWEYMASYRNNTMGSSGFTITTIAYYNTKYFDVYDASSTTTSYNKRILGDATGEMGPFQTVSSNQRSSWYIDSAVFVDSSMPWFRRGAMSENGELAGLVSFHYYSGGASVAIGFRLVLAPQ